MGELATYDELKQNGVGRMFTTGGAFWVRHKLLQVDEWPTAAVTGNTAATTVKVTLQDSFQGTADIT